MKYADYRKEDLVFIKKEDWTREEMKEFIDTCPENEHLAEVLEELKGLSEAIDAGEIKRNKWGELNKNSLRAYAKNTSYIHYGKTGSGYWRCVSDNDAYVMIDGDYRRITYRNDPQYIIDRYKDGGNIEQRFKELSYKYKNAEELWVKRIEKENYSAINKERIKANNRLDAILNRLDICIPNSCVDDCYDYGDGNYYVNYKANSTYLRGSDYTWHSSYGEILVNNVPLSTDKANELYDMTMEMSQKIEAIINEYKPKFKEAFNREGR